jgi:hypothetical protein
LYLGTLNINKGKEELLKAKELFIQENKDRAAKQMDELLKIANSYPHYFS